MQSNPTNVKAINIVNIQIVCFFILRVAGAFAAFNLVI